MKYRKFTDSHRRSHVKLVTYIYFKIEESYILFCPDHCFFLPIPAVVVPSMLALQEKGYGVAKGIPTLVIAASSVYNVFAISAFTVLLGITFKPNTKLVAVIFQVIL